MTEYLNAECVFSFLIAHNIFNNKNWKNENIITSKYYAGFECGNGSSFKICHFEITVKNNTHCILSKALETFAIRFKFYEKAVSVFTDCSIKK